jgi:hypothetical protein
VLRVRVSVVFPGIVEGAGDESPAAPLVDLQGIPRLPAVASATLVVVRDERPAVRPVWSTAGPARRRCGDGDRPPPDLRPPGARAPGRRRAAVLALPPQRGLVAASVAGGQRIKRHGCRAVMSRTTEAGLARRASGSRRDAVRVVGLGLRGSFLTFPLPGARRFQRRRAHRFPGNLGRCRPPGAAGRGRPSGDGRRPLG